MKKYLPWLVIATIALVGISCQYNFETYTSGFDSTPVENREPTATIDTIPTTIDPQLPTISPFLNPTPIADNPPPVIPEDLRTFDDALISLYQYASQGVVSIQILSDQGSGLGSGFVYDQKGHIVTNFHVVEGADHLEVNFPSGLKVRGEVIATDLDSDLAVIRVNVPEEYLIPLPMGDSDLLKVGQSVVAIGNPFGLSGTMTVGIISAKGRTLESIRTSENGGYFSSGDIIQTDAAINPGNSGGPLINLDGEVIGLNRAIRTGVTDNGDIFNSGIGFAISGNIIKRVVPYLIDNGFYDYPYLGVTARGELSLLEQEALGITHPTGAYVTYVTPQSPADQAGIKGGTTGTELLGLPAGGDLIIGVDDIPVRIFGELLSYLMAHKSPGDQITLKLIRDGVEQEAVITLGKRP